MLFSMLQSLSIIVLKMITIDQWYNGLCIWGPIHIDRLEGTKHPSIYILLNESENDYIKELFVG